MTPYASPASRVEALYRLASDVGPERTLEVCAADATLGLGVPWCLPDRAPAPDAPAGHQDPAVELPFEAGRFDRAILHRTLDALAGCWPDRRIAASLRLLTGLARVLAGGGVIAGVVANAEGLHAGGSSPGRSGLRRRELRRLLSEAGFEDVRLFLLLPDGDAPLRIIDDDPHVARRALRRALGPAWFSSPAALLKRAAVEAGLYRRLLSRSVFFVARKPC